MIRRMVYLGVLCGLGLLVSGAPGESVSMPKEDLDRKVLARQPRHLYGAGTIWAKWLNKDRSWDARCFEMIKQMGGTHVGADIPWAQVEPEPGRWDFDYVDHTVAEATKRKLAIFAYMGLTPHWAMIPEAPAGNKEIGYRFPPADDRREDFIRYCQSVARRYKGRIKYYQFWNEPNGCSWIKDGCANSDGYPLYTKWLKIWYQAMKSVDPDCVLGAGAIDYHREVTEGYKYLEGMYREGAKDYFDAFSLHPYDNDGTLHYRAIEDTRRCMVAHGDGHKGLWISEWGWNITDEDLRARRIVQTLNEIHDPKYFYITMSTYLSLTEPTKDSNYGLCNRDLTPKKAYFAFQETARKLQRAGPRPTR